MVKVKLGQERLQPCSTVARSTAHTAQMSTSTHTTPGGSRPHRSSCKTAQRTLADALMQQTCTLPSELLLQAAAHKQTRPAHTDGTSANRRDQSADALTTGAQPASGSISAHTRTPPHTTPASLPHSTCEISQCTSRCLNAADMCATSEWQHQHTYANTTAHYPCKPAALYL